MQTFNANAYSFGGSDTLHNIHVDVARQEVSNQNGVSYRHRQGIEEKANSHKAFPSAISRLPTEILTQIFLYCIPEDGDLTPTRDLAPMLLTTVCRRWREVAVDIPSLWRRLRLEVGHGDWKQRAFCYDTYLKRSRGRQLSLTLECHADDSTELRSLLHPYVDQISSLSVGLFYGTGSCPVVVADFGGLEELVMYTKGSDPVLALAHSITHSITQLPPSMHTLKITDLWLDLKILSGFNPLAWASLTSLEIVVEALDCFPHLLRMCPNLTSLTIIGIFMSAIETSDTTSHPKLQSLRISGDLSLDWIGDFGLFDIITLPSLRAVEVRNVGTWPHEGFKAFLTRSGCPIESLIFGGGVMITDRQLEEYVTIFPSLAVVTDPMRSSFYF
ncbi:uncharacterized protein EDB93DRAFT_1233054 [Suillus bovinus]|uniref:uncharacterized protein n=1 Tax=Suillus bovinus TaxID=48563 RepID=UPI001B8820EF|nr:uncharacterized protein EDB93DRAFT_1233054 [Suillus bovinus]KAG2132901.1 hypothetical protein EDB93DRAFT_1233054 [Suillus bovinus]